MTSTARHGAARAGEPAEAHEHVGECTAIDGGLAAKGLGEHLSVGEPIHEPIGLVAIERRRGEHHVSERLGEHPAETEQHTGTELRIAHHARDQLALARDHLGDEQLDLAILRPRGREQLTGGGAHRRGITQPQPHQPPLGLVGDPLAAELHGDRKADRLGGSRGGLRGLHRPLLGERNAVAAQERLGGGLGERRRLLPFRHGAAA